MYTRIIVFLAKLFVIAFFTIAYITPIIMLFNLIIHKNLDLLNPITRKFYLTWYLSGFFLLYLYSLDWNKNTENE
jgi:hypothetical protein